MKVNIQMKYSALIDIGLMMTQPHPRSEVRTHNTIIMKASIRECSLSTTISSSVHFCGKGCNSQEILVLEDDQNGCAVILAPPLANSLLHQAPYCKRG
jgi:hypothetical protein